MSQNNMCIMDLEQHPWGYDSRLNAILSTKLMNNTLDELVSDCG